MNIRKNKIQHINSKFNISKYKTNKNKKKYVHTDAF